MSKGAASEADLAKLHAKVAKVLVRTLELFEAALEDYDDRDPDAIMPAVPPALLTVATKFLNENRITCAPEDSEEMTALERRLAGKEPKKPRVVSVGSVPVNMDEPIAM